MMERYHWRDEGVPDGRSNQLHVYDRRARQEPIAVCTDPDVAERIVVALNTSDRAMRMLADMKKERT